MSKSYQISWRRELELFQRPLNRLLKPKTKKMEIIKNGIDGAEGYETRCSWGLGDKGWIGCGGPKAWILGFTKIMGLSEKK